VTLQGQNTVVVTIGRTVPGEARRVSIAAEAGEDLTAGTQLSASATIRSSTARQVPAGNSVAAVVHFTAQ